MSAEDSPFARAFRQWLASKGMSGLQASYESDLAASVAHINAWRRGLLPSEDKCRLFFSQFAGEDPEKWVQLLIRSRQERKRKVMRPRIHVA